MELFGIPIFDDDLYKLVFRFAINLAFLTVIIRGFYYSNTKRKDYLFTYYLIGTIVFILCFTLKKFELDLGMALGLFAIFGIIRYRTDPIDIKEMTYLFVVIGVSVVNSLANKKMSYAEILIGNSIVVATIFVLERIWHVKNTSSKTIQYEKIENIKPENYDRLKADLEERTGLNIESIRVGDIDFLRDSAKITITYTTEEQ